MAKLIIVATVLFVTIVMASIGNAQELTVSEVNQADLTRTLSLKDLKKFPQTQFETSTIWTKGKNSFTGVLLKDFIEFIQADVQAIKLTALNDYSIEVPASDGVEDGPIIAYLMNGKELSVRDKGPFWLVYPYDSSTKYRSETIYSRSIWQIAHIEIR